ncbi:MAG: DUF2811 domain-containing protein [Cyanobium sp.]
MQDRGSGRDNVETAEPAISPRVSLEAEVPEVLFEGMRHFISSHPHWDQYSVITSALAGFLFQNGCGDSTVTQHYLDGLFQRQG